MSWRSLKSECRNFKLRDNKNAFQLKAKRPLADRCICYIVIKFENVQGGGSQVIVFEHVWRLLGTGHGEEGVPCGERAEVGVRVSPSKQV